MERANTSHQSGYSGLGPKNYQRSDERIREDACDALFACRNVDASDVEVTVDHGYLSLHGTVGDRGQKKAAEACVENIRGVKDVLNYLTINDRGLIGETHIKSNII